VASVEWIHQWVKAGVMVRGALTANAAHGFMLVSPGKGLAFQRRVVTGGHSTSTAAGAGSAPNWVKLERRGNTLTAYRSADGTAWTLVGSDTFNFGPTVYVGLGLTSHDNTRLATATFDNVSVVAR
jgi:regulation of enolase protein 1 (concanavalin A-like superfamily)